MKLGISLLCSGIFPLSVDTYSLIVPQQSEYNRFLFIPQTEILFPIRNHKNTKLVPLQNRIVLTLNILQQQMNYLSLFKLIIPTLKTTNKILQPQTDKSSELFKLATISPFLLMNESHNQAFRQINYRDLAEPFIRLPIEDSAEENNANLELPSTHSLFNIDSPLQKNKITNRIKSLQYQANNPCEDTLTYIQLKSINAYTVSVFDGHGGPELAEYSKAKINTFIDLYLSEHLEGNDDVGEVIKQALKWSYQKIQDTFFQTYQMQIRMGNKRIRNVGTCGITAVVYNDRVYIANAGDSQIVFILTEGNSMRSIRGNTRLSTNNRNERERILKEWEDIDDDILTQESVNTFYLKGRLQPTRTIGDYYLKKEEYYTEGGSFKGPYLTCQPDIEEHLITKAHKFMIVASDGVWDFLTKQEVMSSLMTEEEIDLSKTCYDMEQEQIPYVNGIIPSILSRASENSGRSVEELKNMQKGMRRNYHDDITIAVVSLEKQLS